MVTRVTLPLVMPAILSGGVLVFALMSGNFAIPSLLGTSARLEFITSSIYRMMQFSPPKFGEAATAGVILMLITLALYALQRRYVGRRNYLSVTGKGFRPRVIKLRGLRWICTLSVFVYALVVIVIPLGALLLRSSRPYFYLSQLSDLWNLSLVKWSNYDLLLSYSQVSRALGNTALLSVMTAAIGGVLFFLIAYGAERMSGKGLPLVRYLSTLPAAIPGMVLGLSYLWVALYLPLPLYGTIWVLLVSYLARFTPQGVGSISSSMRSLHPELEEGARVAGAGLWLRLRAIMFPLSRQGILSAMVLCFVLAVTELHTSILLYTARTTVLSVVMYEFWQSGQWGAAAALSIIQSLLVVSVLIIAWKVLGISLYPELGNDNKKSASNQTED
jgi:iron(III) transport system permease protein